MHSQAIKTCVSLGSRFGRKESTSATGDLYSLLVTRFDTVHAHAGVIDKYLTEVLATLTK